MSTYQTTIPCIVDTAARFKLFGQFFGAGFTTVGWVKQTGHGEQTDNGLSGSSYAWTGTFAAPTTVLAAMASYTFRGAWVSGTTYTGSNSANAAADLVTDAITGLTYVHITASSSSATAPSSDTTNWQPFIYEIWKSNGSNTSSLPIYIRLVYSISNAALFPPRYHLSVGTGVDANGNLTGTIATSGTNPTFTALVDPAGASSSTSGEMDFAGDSDNVRWITYRGGPVANANGLFVIDRAKTSSGTDSDAYFYVGMLLAVSGTFTSRSAVILKSALGATAFNTSTGWAGAVNNGGTTGSLAILGSNPPFVIMPPIGFLSNPLLGVIAFNSADATDGTVIPVWLYGASHNYLINKSNAATAAANVNNVANSECAGIRWE